MQNNGIARPQPAAQAPVPSNPVAAPVPVTLNAASGPVSAPSNSAAAPVSEHKQLTQLRGRFGKVKNDASSEEKTVASLAILEETKLLLKFLRHDF
uniref:Uncharacterized protein n=1 Tax=Romanomermis culicivorax TaxID=13658 RepID=A0A915I4K9_ROMCU